MSLIYCRTPPTKMTLNDFISRLTRRTARKQYAVEMRQPRTKAQTQIQYF